MKTFKVSRRNLIKNSFLGLLTAALPFSQSEGASAKQNKKAYKLNREIPIGGEYDLVVAGGGPSGVAAAICAARLGTKVLLVEAFGCLGGSGTTGLVSSWTDLTDGNVSHVNGVFMEILQRMSKKDALEKKTDPLTWGTTLHASTKFQPEPLKIILDDMCLEAGVELLFTTRVIDADVNVEKKIVNGVIIQNIEGYKYIKAKTFIDATGDAYLADMCGAPSREAGRDTAKIMPPTLCGQIAGMDRSTFKDQQKKVLQAIDDGFFSQPDRHVPGLFLSTDNIGIMNAGHLFDMDALNARSLSDGYIKGRKLAEEYASFYKKYVSGAQNMTLLTTAALMGVRESRNVHGEYELNYVDLKARRHFPDQIGLYAKKVDIHVYSTSDAEYKRYLDEFTKIDIFKIGETYGLPYGILVPKGWQNLWVTGRAVSVDVKVHGSLRDQPGCYVLGQAAGTAAAQSIKKGQAANKLDTKLLVETLRSNGAYLPQQELSAQMTRS